MTGRVGGAAGRERVESSVVDDPAAQQERIGGDKVELGILTTEFKKVQRDYFQERGAEEGSLDRKTKKWMLGVQSLLWELTFGCWQYQNQRVHGEDEKSQQIIKKKHCYEK